MSFIPIAGKILATELPTTFIQKHKLELFENNKRETKNIFKIEKKGAFLEVEFPLKDEEKETIQKELIEENRKTYNKIKEGDTVVIRPLAGTEILLEGRTYFILQPTDILLKVIKDE